MFENITKYDRTTLYAFTDVCTQTVRRTYYRIQLVILLGAGAFCCIDGVFLLTMWNRLDYSSRLIITVTLLIGPCAIIKGLFLRRFMARKVRKNMMQSDGACRFTFTEDGFEAEQPGILSVYRYDRIFKAYEAPGYFVLFFDKVHGSILDMGGFTQGTADEFRAFLAVKLGKPVEYISLK